MFIFQRSILLLSLMIAANGLAQGVIDVHSHLEEKPSAAIATANMIVRIAEIEVYPKYLQEYLAFANEVDRLSIEREPGVICLYPMQSVGRVPKTHARFASSKSMLRRKPISSI